MKPERKVPIDYYRWLYRNYASFKKLLGRRQTIYSSCPRARTKPVRTLPIAISQWHHEFGRYNKENAFKA